MVTQATIDFTPLVRTNDPDTSHAAAASIDATKLEEMVYQAIANSPDGVTADELLARFPGYSYSSITARPAALKRKGLVKDTGERRPGRSGRLQAVLKVAK